MPPKREGSALPVHSSSSRCYEYSLGGLSATPSPRCTLARRSSPQVVVQSPLATSSFASPAVFRKKPRRRKKSQQTTTAAAVGTIVVAFLLLTLVVVVKRRDASKSNRILEVYGVRNSTLNDSASSWKFGEVVHVIETRLMQFQPDLIDLGLARLTIFKHFCLPTISNQTSQNFLWIIRTDPDLDVRLKRLLLELVHDVDNYLVVASNTNPEGFRHDYALDFSRNQVWSGSHELAVRFHEAARTRLVLESRLDADDALHTAFAENLQRVALEYFQPQDDYNKWIIFCAYSHLEWQPSSPFAVTEFEDEEPDGYLVAIKRRDCVTPGLTTAYGLNVSRYDLPAGQHAKLHKNVKSCSDTVQSGCIIRYGKKYPGAMRARTPTSAGMNGVMIGKHGNRKPYRNAMNQLELQPRLWDGVQEAFCISKHGMGTVRSFLIKHLKDIAADNLRGQCTKGHSCKTKSQMVLKDIIESGEEGGQTLGEVL